jgi:hypothetical protein
MYATLKNDCDTSLSTLRVGTNVVVSSAVSSAFLWPGESKVVKELGQSSSSHSDER